MSDERDFTTAPIDAAGYVDFKEQDAVARLRDEVDHGQRSLGAPNGTRNVGAHDLETVLAALSTEKAAREAADKRADAAGRAATMRQNVIDEMQAQIDRKNAAIEQLEKRVGELNAALAEAERRLDEGYRRDGIADIIARAEKAEAALAPLQALVDEARKVIEPFAELVKKIDDEEDDETLWTWIGPIRPIRDAAAFLYDQHNAIPTDLLNERPRDSAAGEKP